MHRLLRVRDEQLLPAGETGGRTRISHAEDRPVLAFDSVVPDEHGLLVPPGDVEALAAALLRGLASPGLRCRLAAARALADKEFTIELMANQYEAMAYR